MKGFTLIEFVAATFIIVLLTSLVLPNYRSGNQQLELQRAAHKLAQDLRRSQEMALSSKEFDSQVPQGYGIYLDKNQPGQYILFADLDGDYQYSGSSEKVEEIALEGNLLVSDLSPEVLSTLNIVFVPPDPSVFFYPDALVATISLGTEVSGESVEYIYYYVQTLADWLSPRADCDTNPQDEDCDDSFPGTALGDPLLYDRFGHPLNKQSKKYEKQESGGYQFSEKTVQVNKVGLIVIE